MKAFRLVKHVDYSDHIKASNRDIANYRTAYEYLSTGVLPPKMGIGEMYSDAMRFSVLRAYAGGQTCVSENPFSTDNATIDLICPGCLTQAKQSFYVLNGGDAYGAGAETLDAGNATTESTNLYVGKITTE